jgi:predicted 2-oxoglutarate/Fe(II)-dependent dioxygenase YbiX
MFIRTIKHFLTKKECNSIIEEFSKLKLEIGGVGADYTGEKLKKVRDSQVILTNIDWVKDKLQISLSKEIQLKGYELDEIEKFQFTKYDIGGHYDWHTDTGLNFEYRFCSIVIQLNDTYSGGELLYKDYDSTEVEFEKGIGNLFIFSSSAEHKVNPITNGIRYSLVSWIKLKEISGYKKTLL